MEPATQFELLMSVFSVLVFAGVAWSVRALSTGRIGRNPLIGIRTQAVTHCDRCWLLGHHAAAAKANIGLAAAVAITVVPAALGLFLQMPAAVLLGAQFAGLAAMVVGLLLGARDARWLTSKIHQS